jgi:hypothetical protein
MVHDTLIVSPGASVTALITDSAIISGPADEDEPDPLARARPLIVMVLPLRLVRIGVESVN